MALLESEQRLRFLTNQLLTAQETERRRISMELHDEVGQSLTVLKLQVRAIERELRQPGQAELKQECLELLAYLDGVIENVRRLSRDLSPAILEDLGLSAALNYLLEGVAKHLTVNPSLQVEDLNGLFPPEAQIIIYRIFQECLNNITKHAGACTVSVRVRGTAGASPSPWKMTAPGLTRIRSGAGMPPAGVWGWRPWTSGPGCSAATARSRAGRGRAPR